MLPRCYNRNVASLYQISMKPLLTVPLQVNDSSKVKKLLQKGNPEVDAFEIWIDSLPKTDLQPSVLESLIKSWKKISKKKIVIVCKDPGEKGSFRGNDRQKVELLSAAAAGGADYIDIGFHSGKKWVETLVKMKKKAQVIVSFHDFEKTPPFKKLQTLRMKMTELGADIIKIATFVNTLEDSQRLIELALQLKKEKRKHIILGMGEKGMVTRILGQKLGNELQFVSVEVATAPGQLTLGQAIQFQNVLK